ncbi:hypothetical protein O181_052300 [Austropuccinia psidii MF-1]|uniref:Uncharacterized protein n=1 Tax=Austropuccinia psidii MF-1 TaxID=1389203 RepID=A0A9Q3E4N3_9BASI|nr:hypothetical protein [Austropuccinia psidii MF-1]
MEGSRTSTSSQMFSRTFDTFLESSEADITAIPVFRPESFPTGNSGDIPVSVQELVYGGKASVVGTSSKPLDRDHELLFSSKKALGTRKDRGLSEGLNTHVLQRKSPEDEGLVENPNHFIRGPEKRVVPKEGKKPSGSSSRLSKQESTSTSLKQGQGSPKAQSEGKGKVQVELTLPTELQNSKERKDSPVKCAQYGKSFDGIQKQGGGKNYQTFLNKSPL